MSDIYLMSVFQSGGAGCIGGFVSQAVKVTEGKAVFSGESRVGPVVTGKELDEFSGLNYFGARYYDPDVAMWMSVDPMRQFWSPYSYTGNGFNPINGVDPDGRTLYGSQSSAVDEDGNTALPVDDVLAHYFISHVPDDIPLEELTVDDITTLSYTGNWGSELFTGYWVKNRKVDREAIFDALKRGEDYYEILSTRSEVEKRVS